MLKPKNALGDNFTNSITYDLKMRDSIINIDAFLTAICTIISTFSPTK